MQNLQAVDCEEEIGLPESWALPRCVGEVVLALGVAEEATLGRPAFIGDELRLEEIERVRAAGVGAASIAASSAVVRRRDR